MIALIAGTGALPGIIAKRLMAEGRLPAICVLEGFEPEVPPELPRITFRLETLGTLLAMLKEIGVTELCMAGAVQRMPIDTGKIDARTAPLVPRIAGALQKGDDGALRVIVEIFEEAGISVMGAHQLLPDLLPKGGVPTQRRPGEGHERDARAGEAALEEMGLADLGQSVVIRNGAVLEMEGPQGTAALISEFHPKPDPGEPASDPFTWAMDGVGDMLGQAADWLSGLEADRASRPGAGAILFKAPKPGQERRADLPVIGPETALQCAEAGFDGIIIEEGGVMVLDPDQVVALLDRAGLFLWVRHRT